jgi:hypothetical protein
VPSDLNQDPRWIRFHDRNWLCPCCGMRHAGLFDLACGKPEFWQGSEEKSPNSVVRTSDNILTEDFCVLGGEYFFVRCVLQLPVVGASDIYFGFGVWATLSKRNFNIYLDTFDSGHQGDLGPWFGWFSNRLKGYPDTLKSKCHVAPREGRNRPYIELESTSHPLAIEQREGITFDRLLEIYALNGHELRNALSD